MRRFAGSARSGRSRLSWLSTVPVRRVPPVSYTHLDVYKRQALSLTIVAGGAVLAPYLHLRFTPLTVVAMTALAALGAGLVGRLLARGTGRQTAPAAPSATGGWSGTGMVLAVAALTALAIGWPAVTGIGSPGELVDSPDAVFHLNRLRLYLCLLYTSRCV